ncbi:hypothetical protein D3C85_1376460 [compost metagenome]
MFALCRPDVVLQPVHQRLVVGHAAQQGHRRVAVQVDKARHQHVVVEVQVFAGADAGDFGRRQNGNNAAIADRQRVVVKNDTILFYCNNPACGDELVVMTMRHWCVTL